METLFHLTNVANRTFFLFIFTVFGWKGDVELEVGLEVLTLIVGYTNGRPERGRQFDLKYDENSARRKGWGSGRE